MSIITIGFGSEYDFNCDGVDDHIQILAAIAAASSGDAIIFHEHESALPYDIGQTVLSKSGVTLKPASGQEITFKGKAAIGDGSPVLSLKQLTNAHIGKFTLDGDGVIPTTVGLVGVGLDRSVGCTVNDVTCVDFAGSDFVSSGTTDCTINRPVTIRNAGLVLGIGHGLDIDENAGTGTQTTNLVINDGVLDGAYAQATKAEHCLGVIYNRCHFTGDVTYGDNVTPSNSEATYNDCTFNGRFFVARRNSGYAATLNNPIFTEWGGVVHVRFDTGEPFVLNSPVFYGRNTIYGHNGTTWFTVSNYVNNGETKKQQRIRRRRRGSEETYEDDLLTGKTVFASNSDTGSHFYGQAVALPFATPQTARDNYRTLCEDPNLQETDIRFAILSDYEQSWSGISNIPIFSGAGLYHFEGYPSTATIKMQGATNDFLSTANLLEGSTIRNMKFDGTGNVTSGGQCIRLSGTSHLLGFDMCAENWSNGAAAQFVETRDTSTFILDCGTIENCTGTGSQDGFMTLATHTSTLIMKNMLIKNCPDSGTKYTCRWATTAEGGLQASVVKGNTRALLIQHNTVFLHNVVFAENSVVDVKVATALLTPIDNCSFEDESKLDIVTTEVNNSVVVGGYTGSGGANIVTVAQSYVDAANDDYSLAEGSSGIGVGSRWWSGANPLGYDKEPFSDIRSDIGCMQTTFDYKHPARTA